jgi:hypothetical protein
MISSGQLFILRADYHILALLCRVLISYYQGREQDHYAFLCLYTLLAPVEYFKRLLTELYSFPGR